MAELLIVLVIGVVLGVVVLDVLLYRRYVEESLLRQLLVQAESGDRSDVPNDGAMPPMAPGSLPEQGEGTPDNRYVDAAATGPA